MRNRRSVVSPEKNGYRRKSVCVVAHMEEREVAIAIMQRSCGNTYSESLPSGLYLRAPGRSLDTSLSEPSKLPFWVFSKKLMTQRGASSGLQCLQCWRCLVPRPEAEEATGPRFPGCSCAAALSFCIYLRTCRCSPISLGSTLCHCIFHYGRSRAPAH